jgi:hypothetical protein
MTFSITDLLGDRESLHRVEKYFHPVFVMSTLDADIEELAAVRLRSPAMLILARLYPFLIFEKRTQGQ